MGVKISDSELIKLLMEFTGTKKQIDLGIKLGMTKNSSRTFMSSIIRGEKPLPDKYLLEIITNYPEFAKKYRLLPQQDKKEDEIANIAEPNSKYSNHEKNEQMKNLEDQVKYLQEDVYQLKKQLRELLDGKSEQREEAV